MVNIKTLLPELKKLVTGLSEDLLARSTSSAEIDAGLREAYTQIEKGGRTADVFEVWREDYLDQVAVAWVLGCVFVRFMEDNHLIDECWLAGEGDRRKQAEDTHELYFREHPRESDREYFEYVFHEVGKIPACHDLFAEGKTPLWAVGPSGDAAMKLLAFWREIDTDSGHLKRTFGVEAGDTRFLGDLYQDLSERARKKYALLQTPVFVEEFILDRTLSPAIDEFGLDEVRMIDPTCGSGHFLLGGFFRLFDLWNKREDNDIVAAQKAFDGVWGVDINPFAVAIARFRLIVAALRACAINSLKKAPAWNIHLATGDSLLFGSRWDRDGKKKGEQQFFATDEESWAPEIYACEDKNAISEILGQQYHAVVGNPPYIIVRDRSLNEAYRARYSSCHQKYSLSVPFAERFFDLAIHASNGRSGFVGQITANSFMKREFGKKLVEEFFRLVELTHVVDASGAYIPGHGTPTVLLFGRNRNPKTESVRAVLGINGEPHAPSDPAQGLVWQSILKNIDVCNAEDAYISTADVPRTIFTKHPWSISGGGVSVLMDSLNAKAAKVLTDVASSIGITCFTLEDDVFIIPESVVRRSTIESSLTRQMIVGDCIRDWSEADSDPTLFPYDLEFAAVKEDYSTGIFRFLWPYRTNLSNSKMFGGMTKVESGLNWFEFGRLTHSKLKSPLSIVFAFVATHNHFVLDRGGHVFNRSAPIIKMLDGTTEDDHLRLLGALNTSVACFWMKQVFHNKGDSTDQHGARTTGVPEFNTYEFTATGLHKFPIPEGTGVEPARTLDVLAREYLANLPARGIAMEVPSQELLIRLKEHAKSIRCRMIALQEELDWQAYRLYGLINEEVCYGGDDLPPIECGERAFEIVLGGMIARGESNSTWFARHGRSPIVEIPAHWPEDYKSIVRRRIHLIETKKEIGLLEDGMYKRRWALENWTAQQQDALRNWMLERLEGRHYWPDLQMQESRLQSIAKLADKASVDQDFMQVAVTYRGREDFDLAELVAELVESESVPFLSSLRYKPAGLRKREVWEKTWELQRKEDAGEDVGDIKVPPKYTTADFQKSDYWRLRGKLDVSKERWISFPHCETESDPSLVVGWAGWNHLQQGTAIVVYYDARKNEGWSAERLTPLLAGLDELLPWIHQWHPEIDPEYNETAGASFQTLLESEAQELGLTLEQIRNWIPPAKKKATKKKTAKKTRKKAKSAEATEGE
ncbi:BREX-2 system adenine-specific DNA-methyltransferase PglX [Gimesia aquarii]|uniref:site-specific DNA-methyltransferase (adenine-specific) n=1 Tax=Gimesia aquarii TaxID=2527964 RepID=A0A517VQQ0_9PLAN|nr:BREX-2 system adenine-specific DNA-methyltransferase PglX [Gimesia aquarii]QDT95270.1 hypothetical protein V144x_07120 [Gimesia aquarii]